MWSDPGSRHTGARREKPSPPYPANENDQPEVDSYSRQALLNAANASVPTGSSASIGTMAVRWLY
ncbi:MAG: hypothetical protein ACRERD_35465, partial [Candidatus Binatia bacterium]